MSIGNLKDSGNQSNNFPYQLKVLQGLQALIDSNNNCCDKLSELLSELLQPQQRKVKIQSVTGPGVIPEGVYSASIANVGTTAGIVDAGSPVSLPAGVTLNFDGGALNNILSEILYDATGTTFLITRLE